MLHSTSSEVKSALSGLYRKWTGVHEVLTASRVVISLDSLAHKQSFTGPPQWWKVLSLSFLAVKQGCTCIRAPPRRLKRFYQVLPTHTQACTSFTGPPQWWKMLSSSFLMLKQACMSFTGHPQWWKLLSSSFLVLKQDCTCFTAPPRRLKLLCQVFTANKQACTRFSRYPEC